MTDFSQQYISPDWPAPINIGALMTTRFGGISKKPYESFNLATHVGDLDANVLHNRAQLIRDQQLESVIWLNQVHGIEAIEIEGNLPNRATPTADASYTRLSDTACAVLVADCMPVMVTDRKGCCVGVAHAGWRGLCAGVIPNLITEMQIEPDQALVWLGPCIGPELFEVGPEVLEAFKSSQSFQSTDVLTAFRRGKGNRYMASLMHLAKMQLAKIGIQEVYSNQECTFSNAQQYFSYRRDGATGRMAALIWIKSH